MRNLAALIPALFLLGSSLLPAGNALAQPLHGISMHGTPEPPRRLQAPSLCQS